MMQRTARLRRYLKWARPCLAEVDERLWFTDRYFAVDLDLPTAEPVRQLFADDGVAIEAGTYSVDGRGHIERADDFTPRLDVIMPDVDDLVALVPTGHTAPGAGGDWQVDVFERAGSDERTLLATAARELAEDLTGLTRDAWLQSKSRGSSTGHGICVLVDTAVRALLAPVTVPR